MHWIHGGASDLPNLALLCYRHHWMVHEGKWQLVRSDDGRMLTIPPALALFLGSSADVYAVFCILMRP